MQTAANTASDRLAAGGEDWEVDINQLDIEAKLAQVLFPVSSTLMYKSPLHLAVFLSL